MREKWARRIVLLTGFLVLLLAGIFAFIQNPISPPDTTEREEQALTTERKEPLALDPERIKIGRLVYEQQNCARCHSIAGQGNPRNPLDGVGIGRTANELRNRIIGVDTLQGSIPESIRKLKQGYSQLANDDLDALVIYMQSLR